MHIIQTKNALETRNKFKKTKTNKKDHEINATYWPRVSGVQPGVTKSKGLYSCISVGSVQL